MAAWIDAFLPTFGLIGLGFFLRRRLVTDPVMWNGLELLTYYVFLPSLLASSIAAVDLSTVEWVKLLPTLWGPLLAGTAICMAMSGLLGHGHPAMTSVVQGGIRFNNYVAFPVVVALAGPRGLGLSGVMAGIVIPSVQVILTFVYARQGSRFDSVAVARQIARNPLILGCAGGLVLSLAGGAPPGLGPFLRALGQASLPLGLVCLGAGLALSSLRENAPTQLLTGLHKLALMPVMTAGIAWLVGLDPLTGIVATLFMATPTASSAYVMARVMGGDARLMAATITLQHIAMVVTLPLWAWLLLG